MQIIEKDVELDLTYGKGLIRLEQVEDNNGYIHLLSFAIIDENEDFIEFDKKRDAIELIKKLNEALQLDMLK